MYELTKIQEEKEELANKILRDLESAGIGYESCEEDFNKLMRMSVQRLNDIYITLSSTLSAYMLKVTLF